METDIPGRRFLTYWLIRSVVVESSNSAYKVFQPVGLLVGGKTLTMLIVSRTVVGTFISQRKNSLIERSITLVSSLVACCSFR